MNLKRKMLAVVSAAALTASLFVTPALAIYDPNATPPLEGEVTILSAPVAAAPLPIYVKDQVLEATTLAMSDGSHLLPVRAVAEALGYTVEWQPTGEGNFVTLTLGDQKVTFPVDLAKTLNLADGTGTLDMTAALIESKTYVPGDLFDKVLGSPVEFSAWRVSLSSDVDLGAADAALTVKKGETFVVGLEGNPTTGYTWNFAAVDGLTLSGEVSAQAGGAENLAGAPSFFKYTFSADQAGEYTLVFTYDRSFAPSDAPLTYTYTITAE